MKVWLAESAACLMHANKKDGRPINATCACKFHSQALLDKRDGSHLESAIMSSTMSSSGCSGTSSHAQKDTLRSV